MPSNLDLVRSWFAPWERGDYGSVDWADPEIDYSIVGGPEPGRWIGVESMARAWRNLLNSWEGYRGVVEEYIQLDDGCVLVLTHGEARGKASGMDVGQFGGGAFLLQLRDGKALRAVVYWDRDRALADLGLPPEGEKP